MRDFCQPDNFHIVLNIFSSYGYFSEEENVKVLKNIHRSLKPGGRLLLDIMGKEVIKRIFQTRDWLEEDGIFLLEERRLSPDEKRIESRWIIINQEKSFETKISLRIYSKSEIRDLLKSCGFSKVKICGDLDGNSYDKNSSRLVVIGYKDNQ